MVSEGERLRAMGDMQLSPEAEWKVIKASDSFEIPIAKCLGALAGENLCLLGRAVVYKGNNSRWRIISLISPPGIVREVSIVEEIIRKKCVESGDCGPCPLNPALVKQTGVV